ncbi:glycosyltransferase [Pelodictyon luteolum]|uniref:Cellulose synthase (UDP-forming) n=1 Tax=Chlorobium luteolum (strain DSM 273 / BCRC 81028 / 2530) TaxID=319225 RepID=Q3B477_CHLL3|nr:cellulose synthase catalytic subunit [Pelodictyon luteolum]ABB23854.1 Cellulose synthase (UDP-forming) [Pelodictyon luteolum DSM 273]
MRKAPISGLFVVLVVLLFIALAVYVAVRGYFLVVSDYPLVERIYGFVFFAAELFVLLHGFGYFTNVLALSIKPYRNQQAASQEQPAVAILIPARHEPKEVLEQTLLACRNLGYPNKTIYILDDSSILSYKDEARELASRFNVELFSRDGNRGAKAGMLNDALAHINAKYIAVFDADQNPMPGFLQKIVPVLEADSRLALVQTPQFYTNTEESRVAWSSNIQQAVFYEYISEGKSVKNAMFCCGTNFVMRKDALDSVGGFEEGSVTEDVATTLKLHMAGWKSLYYEHAYVFGMAPENLGSYFMQQNRWAMGSAQLFRKAAGLFLRLPGSLSPLQWFEYFLSGSYYFIGWAYLILLSAPISYILFDTPSYFMDPSVFMLTFIPYFILSVLLFYSGLEMRHFSPFNLIKGQMLAMISIPVYMRAVVQGVLNISVPFQVTPKDGAGALSYTQLVPQLMLWVLHLASLCWGLLRIYYEQDISLFINVFWIGYHLFLFSGLFYFNEE